jgi:hypothetical protein
MRNEAKPNIDERFERGGRKLALKGSGMEWNGIYHFLPSILTIFPHSNVQIFVAKGKGKN